MRPRTDYSLLPEDELFRRAQTDEAAFEQIVLRYERQVYALALALTGNREDAEDTAQEAFLHLWRSLGAWRGECSARTWVLRITRNAALDLLRRRGSRMVLPLTLTDENGEETEADLPDPSPDASPDAAFIRALEIREVRAAIAELPPDQREILTLRDIQDLSYTELSDLLGLPPGTVKSRLFRARAALKKRLCERNIF